MGECVTKCQPGLSKLTNPIKNRVSCILRKAEAGLEDGEGGVAMSVTTGQS